VRKVRYAARTRCESHFRNLQRCGSGFRNTTRNAKVLELDRDYVMNTSEPRRVHAQDLIERHDHRRIDNTRLSPAEVAASVHRGMPQ
jgi:hypothetical protein